MSNERDLRAEYLAIFEELRANEKRHAKLVELMQQYTECYGCGRIVLAENATDWQKRECWNGCCAQTFCTTCEPCDNAYKCYRD